MQLYHYRSIDSAIPEIRDHTFRFAAREELNDPMEGYVRVFWKGDKPAWEGLMRNYVCSVYQALELYLLAASEDILWKKSVMIDIHKMDNLPIGKKFEEVGNAFVSDTEIKKIIEFYGTSNRKCLSDELHLILQFIHERAFRICVENQRKHGLIPADDADGVLQGMKGDSFQFPFEKMGDAAIGDKELQIIAKIADAQLKDIVSMQMIKFGMREHGFLYGENIDEAADNSKDAKKIKLLNRGRQHRNWMSLMIDYPQMYINQLREMIYPEAFVVCLSGKNDDSAMWGNYADHHRGVCLIYDTDEESRIDIECGHVYHASKGGEENMTLKYNKIKAMPVRYGGDVIERNFFETFGRLTLAQIMSWLKTPDGIISKCYDVISENKDEWRKRYWEAFNCKTYAKLEAWSYEDEYRIYIDNSFGDYDEEDSRILSYDNKSLVGIIFGVDTSEFDKMRIVKALADSEKSSGDAHIEDVLFYQAEYDEDKRAISIRKMGLWKLKSEASNSDNP